MQLLSIQVQAKRFSFCKQLVRDHHFFGTEEAFPTVQLLLEATAIG